LAEGEFQIIHKQLMKFESVKLRPGGLPSVSPLLALLAPYRH
jgi:hypothetical protein